MESLVINEFLSQNILLFYCRYVDDCCLIVRKRCKNRILEKMNEFDSFLKFTCTEMLDNELIYLDTLIVNKNDKLEIAQFRKTSIHSTNMMNYKQAVAPLQYKNSCLNGEIYRAKNCTSNDANLEKALDNIETIFRNNQYPFPNGTPSQKRLLSL